MKALQTPNITSHKQTTLKSDKNTQCYASKRLKVNSFECDKILVAGRIWQPLTNRLGGEAYLVHPPIAEFPASSTQTVNLSCNCGGKWG